MKKMDSNAERRMAELQERMIGWFYKKYPRPCPLQMAAQEVERKELEETKDDE